MYLPRKILALVFVAATLIMVATACATPTPSSTPAPAPTPAPIIGQIVVTSPKIPGCVKPGEEWLVAIIAFDENGTPVMNAIKMFSWSMDNGKAKFKNQTDNQVTELLPGKALVMEMEFPGLGKMAIAIFGFQGIDDQGQARLERVSFIPLPKTW